MFSTLSRPSSLFQLKNSTFVHGNEKLRFFWVQIVSWLFFGILLRSEVSRLNCFHIDISNTFASLSSLLSLSQKSLQNEEFELFAEMV